MSNGASGCPTVITEPDGTVEINHRSDGRNQCSHSQHQRQRSEPGRDIYRRCQDQRRSAELEVIRDNAVADGSTANTLQVKVTDANDNTLAGQAVSVLARHNSATVASTVTTKPDGTVEIQCHQSDGGHQPRCCQHQQQQPEPERDVYAPMSARQK
ncbi:Ig-like domain-containing protein [Escherichia coli]|nr:Ig-like domain-containing protein [Escherichia coli]